MPQLRDAHDVGDELRRIERRFARRRIARSQPDDGATNAKFPSFPRSCDNCSNWPKGVAKSLPRRPGLRRFCAKTEGVTLRFATCYGWAVPASRLFPPAPFLYRALVAATTP